ncbi:MAG: UDP-N-acetylmuramoyl-L-alanyl-D-glutamate--2,6-diaminopimelate ligase [Chroococcopsis gigantea SAG 12.99]|jgi:UDP-N-acetylmuramoyl-L-alanyl-D-glutamate--2,6-diaminopimelate ligase|nr:UDP-N-acetylmuramoyl-L-alanyl-D-glutamate--2,6-diaminopimelate ligase [Chlorogloea purpurea SAG 13.99]MDV2998509.1 UDP-N-acetylmuramoyl-L-alanyl-D-glutamate--2,6-diaminopimelate ligase [Chroococcopsis gigantea SAG 12.99]
MKLRELLNTLPLDRLPGHQALETQIKRICTNSHACQPGDLFIGMPGTRVDGGEFWSSALEAGAVAAVITPSAAHKYPPGDDVCVIQVEDMVSVCAKLSAAFYGYPGKRLQMIGVTGTNGKTTITHLIEYFLNAANVPTALLGTLYTRWPGFQETATHTTPFADQLQARLCQALEAGNKVGVMEVSSHALAQGRVKECEFQVAVFTNLTQDHLDFHQDMEDYFGAKAKLFGPDYLGGRAVINLDDGYGQRLIKGLPPEKVHTYSVSDNSADFYTSSLGYGPTGVSGILHTPQGEIDFNSPLVGQYNLANLLAAIAACVEIGLNLDTLVQRIPYFPGVPGRMERVQASDSQDISVIVDYAHTPDSLENLLKAARPFIAGKMICIFGCGGDRDRTKRPLMGRIAAQLADLAVVTSDNPRTEDPERILQDVVAGVPDNIDVKVVCDRSVAIHAAIKEATPGDGVIIAGKGHEDYQILGTEKVHFDDREQARDALLQRSR